MTIIQDLHRQAIVASNRRAYQQSQRVQISLTHKTTQLRVICCQYRRHRFTIGQLVIGKNIRRLWGQR
jgi:hypothetical protein